MVLNGVKQKVVLAVQKRAPSVIPMLDDARVSLLDLKQRFHKRVLRTKPRSMVSMRRLTFEVTNICNAKCTFCAYRLSTDRKEIMPFHVFTEALDQFVSLGGQEIVLTPVVGDPLIDPNLFEKISYAQSKGVTNISLYTNGIILFANDNYKKLVDAQVTRLDVSIGEMHKQNYSEVYGVPEALYDKMKQGVKALLEYNKQQGEKIRIVIGFRPKSKPKEVLSSQDYIEVIKPYISKRVSVNVMQVFDNFGGMITPADLKGAMHMKKEYPKKHYPCIRLYNAISILPKGDVRLCGCRLKTSQYDDLVIGNVFEQHLGDIYNGERAQKLRMDFGNGIYPAVCKDCSFYHPNV